MLRDLTLCDAIDTNGSERHVPMLRPVNRPQNHLYDAPIALGYLLPDFDFDVVEIPKPLGESLVERRIATSRALSRVAVLGLVDLAIAETL